MIVDQIVATVDGQPILESQLNHEKSAVAQMLRLEKRESEMDQPATFQKRVLEQMIEDRLMDREIRRLGLEATDAQVEQVIQNIMTENNVRSKEDFKRLLRSESMTFEELEENYRKRISRNNFIRQTIQPKIHITDEDVQKIIQEDIKGKNARKRFYEFAMLFVPNTNMNDDQFLELYKRAKSGESFEGLSAEYSVGPLKDKKGYMGKVNEEDLDEKVKDVLIALQTDQISKPIQFDNGHVLVKKMGEGVRLETLSDKEKAQLQDVIFNQRVTESLNQAISRLKQNATIEIFI